MSLSINIAIENHSQSGVSDQELRAVTTAVLAKSIFDGRSIPAEVKIKLVKRPIRRDGQTRTAELRIYDNGDRQIVVSFGGRRPENVLYSTFHELTHLIRVCSGDNHEDLHSEEVGNAADMQRDRPVTEWITAILMFDSQGELRRLSEYGNSVSTQNESDRGAGQVVRPDYSGETIRLEV